MEQPRFSSSASRAVGGRYRKQFIWNKDLRPLWLFPLWLVAAVLLCSGCQSNPFASEPAGSKAVQAAIAGPTGVTVNIVRRLRDLVVASGVAAKVAPQRPAVLVR